MTIIVEGARRLFVATPAEVIEVDRELAWAEKYVQQQPDIKWVLGNYVEADNANENGHIFPLKDLQSAQRTVANKPLNVLHRPHYIVGHYVASELLYPTGENASIVCPACGTTWSDDDQERCPECGWDPTVQQETSAIYDGPNAHVEALAAFYHYYFPDVYKEVEQAHKEGNLYFSMETVPETISCIIGDCGKEFAYEGRQSPRYCDHLNAARSRKRLNRPHFTAGALIMPPVLPGWKRADITELSRFYDEHLAEVETAYEQITTDSSHLSPLDAEALSLWIVAALNDRTLH